MGDDAVGDAGKPFLRFPVVDRQGFAKRIGAGHDQGEVLRLVQPCHPGGPAGCFVEQQVVQRRIGQHDPDMRQIGRHGGGDFSGN